MYQPFAKLKPSIAIIIAVAAVLAVLSPWGRRCAAGMAAPVSSAVSWVLPGTYDEDDELTRLKERNAELTAKLAESALLRRENAELRAAAALPLPLEWRGICAEVISRDPERWQERMMINRGTEEGVVTGAVVLSGNSVLGRVIRTDRHAAEVATLLAPECSFGVGLSNSPVTGVMTGGGQRFENGSRGFAVDFLPRELAVTEQQYIVTSGLGGWMPGGLPVGTILKDADAGNNYVHVIEAVRGTLHCIPIADIGICKFVTVLVPANNQEQ